MGRETWTPIPSTSLSGMTRDDRLVGRNWAGFNAAVAWASDAVLYSERSGLAAPSVT